MERDEKGRWFDFFASERGRLLNYIRGRIQRISDMDAEDIVGEVMLHIVSKIDTYGPVENIAAYAYRAIRNGIADYQRRASRTVSFDQFVDDDASIPLMAILSDGQEDVCTQAEREERLSRLAWAMGELEPRQRAILIATEMQGRSFRELSDAWHEPMGTLLSRKCRAVKALRAMLNGLND